MFNFIKRLLGIASICYVNYEFHYETFYFRNNRFVYGIYYYDENAILHQFMDYPGLSQWDVLSDSHMYKRSITIRKNRYNKLCHDPEKLKAYLISKSNLPLTYKKLNRYNARNLKRQCRDRKEQYIAEIIYTIN